MYAGDRDFGNLQKYQESIDNIMWRVVHYK